MTSTIVQKPSAETISEWVESQYREQTTITIFGQCQVEYDGRAESTTSKGDRFVLCKNDGTVLVHTEEKTDPQNWQPPGASLTVTQTNPITLVAKRSSPDEVLRITFNEVYHAAKMHVTDNADFEFKGSERDMHEYVYKNPSVVEDGLRTVEREYETGAGPVDIRAIDEDGNTVIIELKRRAATPRDAEQTHRYMSHMDESPRAILVAPSFSDRVKSMLDDHGIGYVQVDPPTFGANMNSSLDDFG